ncbi:MAG: cyclic nucleotide-binding domain-containing protein [Betaproteobacteria bacterium]|nr:cyclic nucleotide-binding domain-containing protein [Betaproteobacteria bacterium]
MPLMDINSENFGNRFEILQELGKGANGEVHLAFDNFLQRQVAIKIIRRKASDDAEADRQNRNMWLNETRLAGKLLHPFIVQVMEAGSTDDFDYLIMEYLAGGTLKQFTVPGKLLPLDRVIDILYKVCNALDYANKMGVLHRDIKPENILLGENNAIKISDFGAAYCNDTEVTQVLFVGSLAFMPPELFRNEIPTIKSDIYAVGVMAYQLLTGMLPFTADSHEGLILEKLNQDAVPMDTRRHDIPPSLRFAVHRAMHRDPAVRYDTWKDFCDDLAIALPLVPRPEEANFDSAHFNVLRELPFFFRFTDIELWETVGIGHWQKREPGETIVEEDVAGRSLFVIISGEARVTKKGVELNRMGTGECFGEMTYLDENQLVRSATVTAESQVTMIEIEGASLRHASSGLQARFSNEFLKLMINRLRHADERFVLSAGLHV